MNIHHDLEAIKSVAMHYAKNDGYNYNIILNNPNADGEFDLNAGSTYEFVMDSYFNSPRPNAIVLFKTKDLIAMDDAQRLVDSFSPYSPYMKAIEDIRSQTIKMDFDMGIGGGAGKLKKGLSLVEVKADGLVYKNGKDGIERMENTGRNDKCNCGSGKKFKKCCGR